MSGVRTLTAEIGKLAALPAAWVAVAVATLGSLGVTVLNAAGVRDAVAAGDSAALGYTSAVEAAFSAVPLGTVGAVILGVVAMSSEYTPNGTEAGGGRQITTTLTTTPSRWRVLVAKALAVSALVLLVAAVTVPACLAVAHVLVGDVPDGGAPHDAVARTVGTAVYWALTALLALAVTVVTRSGLVPLVVLVVNSSTVSFSLLVGRLTPLARFLPDAAGISLFARDWEPPGGVALAPLAGGLVMAAWAVGALAVAGLVLTRRDA
ncbi:ABC transporter permease [Cellulomonas sp. HD19AZ1]|uniref:ABC transporter permease n=1 Tax=Cellulomonas sp. HD19AZ1 TaxID=2559593 RepID=UPI00107084F9|nr:ABC transporter permease [Cellulomonas sp. HD19AZ1]TFH74255.1 ABC transporter permease [Cellulomonas sp. HD19AZ1]